MEELSKDFKIIRVSNAVAAGQTDIVCNAVDTSGFENISYLAAYGTISASSVTSLTLQDSATNGSFADIAGSKVSVTPTTDNNTCTITDLIKPAKRWSQATVKRATANAVVDGVFAFLYNGKTRPIVADATVSHSLQLNAPADGTP